MGKHSIHPQKTDIPHVTARIIKTRTHILIVVCKHLILEGFAGFIAILAFEANRHGWLNLIGVHEYGPIQAIQTFVTFM